MKMVFLLWREKRWRGVACTFDDQRLGGDLPQLAESSLRLRPGDDVVPHLVEKHHFTFLPFDVPQRSVCLVGVQGRCPYITWDIPLGRITSRCHHLPVSLRTYVRTWTK